MYALAVPDLDADSVVLLMVAADSCNERTTGGEDGKGVHWDGLLGGVYAMHAMAHAMLSNLLADYNLFA